MEVKIEHLKTFLQIFICRSARNDTIFSARLTRDSWSRQVTIKYAPLPLPETLRFLSLFEMLQMWLLLALVVAILLVVIIVPLVQHFKKN